MAFNPPAPVQKDKEDETELRKALTELTDMINRTAAASVVAAAKSAEYTITAVTDAAYADNTWTASRDTLTAGFGPNDYLTIPDAGVYIMTGFTSNTGAGVLTGAVIQVNGANVAFTYCDTAGSSAANAAVTMYLAANDQVSWRFYNADAGPGRLGITRIGA